MSIVVPLRVVIVGECGSGKTEYSHQIAEALKQAGYDVARHDQSMAVRTDFDAWFQSAHGYSPRTAESEESKREHGAAITAHSKRKMQHDRFVWAKYYLGRNLHLVLTGGMRTDADEEFTSTLPYVRIVKIHASPETCMRRIGEEAYRRRAGDSMETRAREFQNYHDLIVNDDDDPERLRRDVDALIPRIVSSYEAALQRLSGRVEVHRAGSATLHPAFAT